MVTAGWESNAGATCGFQQEAQALLAAAPGMNSTEQDGSHRSPRQGSLVLWCVTRLSKEE